MCITNNIIIIVFCSIILYSAISYLDDGKENFINLKKIKNQCNSKYVHIKRTCKKKYNIMKTSFDNGINSGVHFLKKFAPKEIKIKF
jgi:hypothetical protein